MPRQAFEGVLQYLRTVFQNPADRDLTDAELLRRFLTQREETAFTLLVQRHGPMVQSICRRVLGDFHSAEESFQATFIVLIRRAASIRCTGSLANWLYGVAQRIALKARTQKAARHTRERPLEDIPRAEALDKLSVQELRTVLDEEIARLSEKYRAPIVLCYFEDKSYDQAARELGCSKSSLAKRLTRARELLRRQLVRRGMALSAGALATALCDKVAGAHIPALVTINTVKATTLAASGKAVAGSCLSSGALALAEEAMAGMFWIKTKMVLVVMAIGSLVGGAGWAGYEGLAQMSQATPAANAQASAPKKKAEAPAKIDQPIAVDQFGDPLPEGAVARLGAKRFRHEGRDVLLAFTADGKTLAGCTTFGVILWDAETGAERHRLPIFPPWNSGLDGGLAASHVGDLLAISERTSKGKPKIGIWNAHSGKRVQSLSLGIDTIFQDLWFSPDGKSLAATSAADGRAVVFDLSSGKVRARLGRQDFHIFHVAVSPDSKTLAAAAQDVSREFPDRNQRHSVQLWDIASGTLLRTLYELPPSPPGNTLVTAITYSPDGKVLAFGFMDHFVLVDLATGRELNRLEVKGMGQPIGLAFTPDGEKLVTAGIKDGTVRLWNIADGKMIGAFKGRFPQNTSMALSPDGRIVALGSWWTTVQRWDVFTGKELLSVHEGHDSAIQSLAYSPDGKVLASSGLFGAQTILWDMTTRRRSAILPGGADALAFCSDGKKLARIGLDSISGKIEISDVAKGSAHAVVNVPNRFASVLLSTDGEKVFTLQARWPPESSVSQWSLATTKMTQHWRILLNQTRSQRYSFLGSDGKKVVEALDDGSFAIHDVHSGQSRFRGARGKNDIWALTPSPDGKELASWIIGGAEEGAIAPAPFTPIRFLETVTGMEIGRAEGHRGKTVATAWSLDGRLFASGDQTGSLEEENEESYTHQTIRIWDTATGKKLAEFAGFKTDVCALAFVPDGSSVAAGLCDGTILIFDLPVANRKPPAALKLSNQDLKARWTDLRNDNGTEAYRALWSFVASPEQSVPFLREWLKPVAIADQAKLKKWIADLDSDKFSVRQASEQELAKTGEQVVSSVQKALKGNVSLEARRRLEQILNNLSDIRAPENLRNIRAIMVLERIGSPDAQEVLETMASGAPGARETEEAKAALERLAQRGGRMR